MFARQKTGTPESIRDGLHVSEALTDHHDEGRQVFVYAPQSVADPGSHGGTPGQLVTGLQEGNPGFVVDGFSVKRMDHAEFVGHARGMRIEITDPQAILLVAVSG